VRIVDCFTQVILYARRFARGERTTESAEEVFNDLSKLIAESKQLARDNRIADEIYESAKYPVIAFVDELLLCCPWSEKAVWKNNTLQRKYFNTTNAGADFYSNLNKLNKFGPDRDIREVYALCLGLGFRGKYYKGEDRKEYEEIKAFNLSLLLPDEANKNIDDSTLFPFAYKGYREDGKNGFKPRFNIYPYLFGVPTAVIVIMIFVYQLYISSVLGHIQNLIKF